MGFVVHGWTLRCGIGAVALGLLGFAPSAASATPNGPPVNTVPGAQSVNEDADLVFSSANGNAISVADPDALATDDLEITLTGVNGNITLATTAGLTNPTGNGSPSVSFQGTIAETNAALNGLKYRGTSNYNGPGSLTIETDDLGHNGDDGAKTDTDMVSITVNPVNDTPVNTLWSNGVEPSVNEDDSIVLSGGNTVSVADVDAAGDDLRVQLTVSHGRLTVTNLGGLSFVNGDGTDDSTMTFEGTLTELNASLAGMTYKPDADFTGPDTFQIITNDLGHNGSGGAKQLSTSRIILVRAINGLLGGMGTYKGVPLLIAPSNGNDLSINDAQHGADPTLHVWLGVTHGTLTLGTTTNSLVAGNGSSAVTLDGTRTQIDSDLGGGITFMPAAGFTGSAALSVDTDDSNAPPNLDDSDTKPIRVDTPEETVYFAGSKNTNSQIPAAIGRADLDGGGGANLLGGNTATGDNPSAIAIDLVGERIYWSMSSTSNPFPSQIWSAKLDGTDKQLFISSTALPPNTKMSGAPGGLIIDATARRIYWTSTDTLPPFDPTQKVISYASLDDPTAAGGTISTAATAATGGPRALALDRDGGQFYWADTGGNAIGFSPAPGVSGTASKYTVTGVDVTSPLGIAFNPATDRLYWANNSGSTETTRLKYADLDGSTSITGHVFNLGVSAGGGLRSMALDPLAGRLYWGNTSSAGRIEYAALDSSGSDSGSLNLDPANHNSLDGVTLLKDPEPVTAPSIAGTPQVGSELTCGNATWAADLLSGSLYRMPKTTGFGGWTRNGTPIPGASSSAYTPTEAGTYRCTRTATNFAGTSTQTSAPLTVVNQPPTCNAISKSTAFGQPAALSLGCTGQGSLTYSIVSAPSNGATSNLDAGAGTLTYTPTAGFSGTDELTFRASNDGGDSNIATATITVARESVVPLPANDFAFGKAKLDTKHGTAKLPVDVPGAGAVELAKTKDVKADGKHADAAGTVKLLIKARGDAADKLAKKGAVKVTAQVTFTPDGGAANTETTKVKLKLSG